MTPEAQLVERLSLRQWTLALAESCTGGLVAQRVTSVPGASAVFRGGVVAYADAVKQDVLGVAAGTLLTVGAVSAETALSMAQGARKLLRATVAAAITGIAGPAGGSDAKPVGLVFVAVASASGDTVERCLFGGSREAIRQQAADAALRMLLDEASVRPAR